MSTSIDRAVVQGQFVLYRGSRDDQPEVELALQSFLDHIQVKESKEPASKAEAERRRTVFFVGQCRVVDRQFFQGLGQVLVLVGTHRIDRRKDNLPGRLIAGNRFRRLAIQQRDRVADLNVLNTLDAGDDIPDLAGAELCSWIELELVVAHLVDFVVVARVHEMDRIAGLQRPFHHPTLQNHSSILVEVGVEDQRFQRRVRVALGARQMLDDARQHVVNAETRLGGNGNRRKGIEPQIRINLLAHPFDVGGRKIDLVDHRQKFQIVFQGQIEIGDRLRLDALRSIDDHQRTLARHQGTPNLVRKIDVAGSVDQVQQIVLTVRGTVIERDRIALDGNAPFTFDIHRIEHLVVELTLRHATTGLDQSIGQSRLAVINVGDNAKVPNLFHTSCSSPKSGKRAGPSLTLNRSE